MHPRYLKNFETEVETIRSMSNMGFVFAFDISMLRGIAHVHNEFPLEWMDYYGKHAFHAIDPIFLQGTFKDCQVRWSEVRMSVPIVSNVVKLKAADYGLKYGALISIKRRTRNFLSCARHDREFEDAEIELLGALFNKIIRGNEIQRLSKQHLSILSCLRNGASQKELSASLGIPYPTVRKRLQEIYTELDVKTPSQAVGEAVDRNLI